MCTTGAYPGVVPAGVGGGCGAQLGQAALKEQVVLVPGIITSLGLGIVGVVNAKEDNTVVSFTGFNAPPPATEPKGGGVLCA